MQTIERDNLTSLGTLSELIHWKSCEGKVDGVKPRPKYVKVLVLAMRTDTVQLPRMGKNWSGYKRLVANVRI